MRRLVLGCLLLIGLFATSSAQFVAEGVLGTHIYNGPGDVVAGASAWYSCQFAYSRAVANAATQKTCNLQRPTDNHTCDVIIGKNGSWANTANCSNGADNGQTAASFCTGTTCDVVKIYDQSGANFCAGGPCDLTQGNGHPNSPTIAFNAIGTNSVIAFSSASGQFFIGSTNFTQTYPIFISGLAKYINNGAQSQLIVLSGQTSQVGYLGAVGNTTYNYAGTLVTHYSADGVYHKIQAYFNSPAASATVNPAQSVLNLDGIERTDLNIGHGTASGSIQFGADGGGGAGTHHLNGDAGEIGFWNNTTVSAVQRIALCNNQEARWLTGTSCAPATLSYYADATNGNDSNTGLSPAQAWQTINKINGFNFNSTFKNLSLNLTGNFTGCLSLNTSTLGTPASLNVAAYNGGYTLTTNCSGVTSTAFDVNGIPNVTINGGTILSGFVSPSFTSNGILIENSTGNATTNFTVENATVRGIWCFSLASGCGGSSISTGGPGYVANVSFLSNVVGGLTPGAPDTAGFAVNGSAGPFYTFLIQNNTIKNFGGEANDGNGPTHETPAFGVEIIGGKYGTIQQNYIHDIGGNSNNNPVEGGSAGLEISGSTTQYVTAQYNVIYNVQPISFTAGTDWIGMNIDSGAQNVTYQFNYVNTSFGPCLGDNSGASSRGNVFRYNVAENCMTGFGSNQQSGGGGAAWTDGGFLDLYNNTLYATTGPLFNQSSAASPPGLTANNIFYGNASGQTLYRDDSHTSQPVNNAYFQSNASGFKLSWNGVTYTSLAAWQAAGIGTPDASGLTSNPSLTNPGGAGQSCLPVSVLPQTCPNAYKLQVGSPMIGAGNNLTITIGNTQDFYGETIPNGVGTGFNVGADGGNP